MKVEILSMTGKTIKKIDLSNIKSATIDASTLSDGMYILRIKADNNISIEKIIKI